MIRNWLALSLVALLCFGVLVSESSAQFSLALEGDFNEDGQRDISDLDDLTRSGNLFWGYFPGPDREKFDLTGDHFVNYLDIAHWLSLGTRIWKNGQLIEGPGTFMGDIDLDGNVDKDDLDVIEENLGGLGKKTYSGRYSDGDVDGSGEVDVFDLELYFRALFLTINP